MHSTETKETMQMEDARNFLGLLGSKEVDIPFATLRLLGTSTCALRVILIPRSFEIELPRPYWN